MSRPRRFAGLAIIAALVMLITTPGIAVNETCGGFSPRVRSCGFSGFLDAQDLLTMHGGPLFIGSVIATITTPTGHEVDQCDFFLPLQDGVCNGTRSGLLLPGQSFTLSAHTAQLLTGIAGLAVGNWSITFTAA